MPFVQGHLRNESITISIETECAHCSRSIRIEVGSEPGSEPGSGLDSGLDSEPGSELNYRVVEGTDPLVFVPLVNFEKLKDPSIIDAF
jgi:hypothetical protein